MYAYECKLGAIFELKTPEVILNNSTLGFDATPQEEVHVNSIHITTKSDCFVVAVDELQLKIIAYIYPNQLITL